MKRSLENKIAWVTGAGSGIGQNAAIKLSELGMKVILSGRNLENLKETSSKCKNENFIKTCDISKKSSVKKNLAAKYGDKKKITRGDIIAAAKEKKKKA